MVEEYAAAAKTPPEGPTEGDTGLAAQARTLAETLWLVAFGFLLTTGMWALVMVLLHIIDSILGIDAFSTGYVVALSALGIAVVVMALPFVAFVFAYRPLARIVGASEEVLARTFTRAAFPPLWILFVLSVFAFGAMLAFWLPSVLVSPVCTLCIFLPVCIPVPLVLPALFWLAFGASLKPTRTTTLLVAFFWGFLSTVPSMLLNSSGESLVSLGAGPLLTGFIATAIIAPLVEETMKPLILLPFVGRIKDERDGFMIGLAAGIGFAVIENFLYIVNNFQMSGPLLTLRSYNMVLHAIGPCIIGYFIGKARRKGNLSFMLLAPLGWVAGVAIHMIWNGASSLNTIIGALADPTVSGVSCIVYLVFMLVFPLVEWSIVLGVGLRAKSVGAG